MSAKCFATIVVVTLICEVSIAGVPQEINYQGKVEVNGVAFDGIGQFKFAIVDTTGTLTLWSNDGTTETQPTSPVLLNVTKGLYSVRLGDTSYPGMTQPISPSVFGQSERWLRVWFNDTTHGFQKMGPDQKLVSVPYAMMAQTVPDNSINGWKLQRESVWPEHEGRGNTVVAYYGTYNGGATASLGTVPPTKTFVITDIYFSSYVSAQMSAFLEIRVKQGASEDVIYQGLSIPNGINHLYSPTVVSLRSGIPVAGGSELLVGTYAGSWPQSWCIVAGYEFSP
ncbi:hypothetical protein ACFL34_03345 [Candidatus Sumerlaeota bacterium]